MSDTPTRMITAGEANHRTIRAIENILDDWKDDADGRKRATASIVSALIENIRKSIETGSFSAEARCDDAFETTDYDLITRYFTNLGYDISYSVPDQAYVIRWTA